ncbi:MAG TPA: CpsD/CapB family tyrosine-protein kinase, partial [Actinomycetota bacterium]|nr:CpsD/CapB family tyrosine-protein kinase [Actinomycetota bacterium]
KSRGELERRVGAPVLAAIPRFQGWKRGQQPILVMVTDPKSYVAEAYRTLATNVLYVASQRPLSVVLITSSTGGEGKTTTAANLGLALAQSGKRVILVSADMRRPRLHEFFSIENRRGLSDLLQGKATLVDVAVAAADRNLRVVPAGPVPENPAGLLGSRRAAEFLESARSVCDFLVLDAPPALAVADASTLAPRADGTLYVMDAERTGRTAIEQARNQLENVGANVIGTIYNAFDPSHAASYGYYYAYYEAYYGLDERGRSDKGGRNARGGKRGRHKERVSSAGFGDSAPIGAGVTGPPTGAIAAETPATGSPVGVATTERPLPTTGNGNRNGNGHSGNGNGRPNGKGKPPNGGNGNGNGGNGNGHHPRGNGGPPGRGRPEGPDDLPLWWTDN